MDVWLLVDEPTRVGDATMYYFAGVRLRSYDLVITYLLYSKAGNEKVGRCRLPNGRP